MRTIAILITGLCAVLALARGHGTVIRGSGHNFTCYRKNNFGATLIRTYLSIGKQDPDALENFKEAKKADTYLSGFLNPCPSCNIKPEDQVKQALKGLPYFVFYFVTVQLDSKWSNNKTKNCEFLNRMLNYMSQNHHKPCVGTNKIAWDKIMGDCKIQSHDSELWWDYHDGKENYDSYKPFAGFDQPTLKEYAGRVSLCGSTPDVYIYG